MDNQWTTDWNGRFLSGDTPWEDDCPSDVLAELLHRYTKGGERVLEVGCGLGVNAVWMAMQGYRVTALDVAPEAVRRAGKRAVLSGVPVSFCCCDFLAEKLPLPAFSVVFDKGCFHSFIAGRAQKLFVERVGSYLVPNGIWITICGCADTPGDPVKAERNGYPRMTATQIASLVEQSFEILSLSRCRYGVGADTGFQAWAGVFKKRQPGT